MRLKKLTLTHLITKLAALAILVFTLSALAIAQTEGTIHNFEAGHDGAVPLAGLIADSAGNLYGTTYQGGGIGCNFLTQPIGCGTVFELTPALSGGHWNETILYAFQGGIADGYNPATALVFDTAGNLYGATLNGGPSGFGTIFELSPPALPGGTWTEVVLYSFGIAQGGAPRSLVLDAQGNLYGEANGSDNDGQIFALAPPSVQGGSWTFSPICSFTGPNGSYPIGGLVLDAHGNLYGSTYYGGPLGSGLVFELVKPTTQGGVWTENVLHFFTGTNGDGADPFGGVIFHGGNHLYGTTAYGGIGIGDGTVFELSPTAGGSWTETTLYEFDQNTGGGFRPDTGVVFDRQGNLYGTATFSPNNGGEVFKLATPAAQGDHWTFTLLNDFTCGAAGCYPLSALIFDKSNILYGTASGGGSAGYGVVYGVIP